MFEGNETGRERESCINSVRGQVSSSPLWLYVLLALIVAVIVMVVGYV